MVYDVVIIGAGVVGSLIARELTKYNLKTALLEAESDVASGTSKANSAIVHAGFDAAQGSLKALLNVRGNELMPALTKDLGVHYSENGSLVCAEGIDEENSLELLLNRGIANRVRGLEIIRGERLFSLEPNLSKSMTAALYAPTAGIVCPYMLTIAAVSNAVDNGLDLFLNFRADSISDSGEFIKISCANKSIDARYIVNCAGLYADDLARVCGDTLDFTVIPRKGEYLLLDKIAGNTVHNTIFAVPSDRGKGILVSPTVDGNLILGPNAVESLRSDVSTSADGLAEIEKAAKRLIPSLNMRQVITSFAGVRSTPSNHDFNFIQSRKVPHCLHLLGIESPGLASSPAIAEYTVRLLADMGLDLSENLSFCPTSNIKKPFRDMSDLERAAAIAHNPLYGRIICRCETVTEAEIIDAITSSCPALSLDAVKRRTRAGMGRCQGGFCSPRVVQILADTLRCDLTDVTKSGGDSYILTGKTK